MKEWRPILKISQKFTFYLLHHILYLRLHVCIKISIEIVLFSILTITKRIKRGLVFLDYWIDLCCSLATRTHTRCLQAIASQISLGWCLLRTRSTLPAWRFYCTSIGLASEPFIKTSRDTLWWVFEILSKYNGTTHESAINALNYIV